MRQFDVGHLIADHKGSRGIDIEILNGALDHAGIGFTAPTDDAIFTHPFAGMMRTVINRVE